MQICDYRTQSQLSLNKLTQIQCFIQLVYVNTITAVCTLLSSFITPLADDNMTMHSTHKHAVPHDIAFPSHSISMYIHTYVKIIYTGPRSTDTRRRDLITPMQIVHTTDNTMNKRQLQFETIKSCQPSSKAKNLTNINKRYYELNYYYSFHSYKMYKHVKQQRKTTWHLLGTAVTQNYTLSNCALCWL